MSEFKNITLNNEIANNPVGVPSDQFTFQTIADLEIPENLAAFDQGVDPEYEAMLNAASKQINTYFPGPTSNYNSPIPGESIGRYNPVKQQLPPDLNTMEGKIRAFSNVNKQKPVFTKTDYTFGDPTKKITDPIYSGIVATQFDRYYSHPAFSRLGFHPYRNNEEFYNENSSMWEDSARMFGQLGKLMGTGYASSYRSWFDTDVMDLQSAIEYEDAVRIGTSSRDGFAAGLNNFVLNSGYTFGIIGSIAAEELLMWGATAAAGLATAPAGGVGAAPLAGASIARTAYNMKRLGTAFRSIGQAFDVGKAFNATRAMVGALKSADKARDFWTTVKTGDNVLGKILLPETMSAFKNLNTTKKAGENLSNMAKVSSTFGGLYRDMRSLNFALSEGRMEAGMVYKEQLSKEYLIQLAKNKEEGLGDLTAEQMTAVNERAREAAFTTTMFNAPVIYLSNQLLLGNAFGGYKRSLAQIAREGIEGAGAKIIKSKSAVKTVKETLKGGSKQLNKELQQDLYEKVEKSFLNWKYLQKGFQTGGIKGLSRAVGSGALRYTVNNISEGLQEVYQEAVSAGVKDYYTSLAFDPMAGGYDLFASSTKYGLGEQVSGQGLETFLSGFFMGGLVGGPQKAIFQGIPTLYQKTANKKEYNEYKAKKDKYVDDLVEFMNKAGNDLAKDPTSFFGIDKLNFIAQKQIAQSQEEAQVNENYLDFIDLKDYAKFQQLFTLFETGKQGFFKEQLQDYLELTDVELGEMFPSEKARAKSGKLRQALQEQILKIDELGKHLEQNQDKYKITADPSQYTPGTKDYEEESLKYLAQRHAKFLYLFTRDGFQRAAERTNSIYQELASDPVIKELASNDLTVLLTKDSLQSEIDSLIEEVKILGEPGSKQAKKQKEQKLAKLQAISEVLYNKENIKKDGSFDRRKINKLAPKITEYLQMLAKDRNSFVDNELLADTINKIVDHNHLSVRQTMYDKAIRVLTDPIYLDDLITRSNLYFKFAYNSRFENYKKSINLFINKEEINHLLNQLADLGVHLDMEDALLFGETGDPKYLQNFYDRDGRVYPEDKPELYEKIQEKIEVYKQTASTALKEEAEKRAEKTEEESKSPIVKEKNTSKILEDAEIEGPESKIYGKTKDESPVLDEVITRIYEKNNAILLKLDPSKVQTPEEFLNGDLAKRVVTAYNALKKIWYQTLSGVEENVKMEKFHKDQGFIQWLKLQKTNDLVFDILDENLLTLKVFVPELLEAKGRTEEDEKQKNIDFGTAIDIVEKTGIDLETREPIKYYELVDKSGNFIADEIYEAAGLDPLSSIKFSTEAKAIEARKKLTNYVPVYDSFEFDGVQLTYGRRVQDKKTKEFYIVLSNPNTVKKYNNLLVIKEKDLAKYNAQQAIRNAEKLSSGEFSKKFITEKINSGLAKLPENVTKLRVDEATAVIPHENDRGTEFKENEEKARQRFAYIINNLSPEDLAKIEVRVSKNIDAGSDLGYLKFGDKNANPFIKTTKSPYNIALVLPNSIAEALKPNLEALDLQAPKDNILGYIPNGGVILFNKTEETINPLSIESDQVKDLFNIYTNLDQAVSNIQQNFAIQYTIMNKIAEKMGESDSIILSLEDIGGVNFSTTPGEILHDNNDKSILDLNVQTVDGTTVVLENVKGKGGDIATRFITNAERGQGSKIKRKVIAEMQKQNANLYAKAQEAGRYVMVVKSPSGIYSFFTIKSDELNDEQKRSVAQALISKSVETVKNNIEEGSDITEDVFSVDAKKAQKTKVQKRKIVKDLKINVEFNKDINGGEIEGVTSFYIASKPGYDFDINVGANGSVFIKVYNRTLNFSHNIIMSAEEVAQYEEFENKEKFIDALVNKYNNEIDNIDVKKISKNSDGNVDKLKEEFFKELKKTGSLNSNAFKLSFDKNVTTDEIIDRVTTQISPNIRGNSKLITNIDGVDVQDIKSTPIVSQTTTGTFTPSERFTDAEGNPIASGPTMTVSTQSLNDPVAEIASLEELTLEEYNELKNNNFAEISKEQREYIAKRFAENGSKNLTDREKTIINSSMGSMIRLLSVKYQNQNQPKSNAASPATANIQEDRISLAEQSQKVDNAILGRKDQIIKQFAGKLSNTQIRKKWESDPEIKKLEKEKADIENKLTANKISDNLNLDDIRHIDDFVAWASENLPDFITIENIRTLADNMKSGGERVGAFVMALEKIAGKEKIGGKLYVGATSKYAYHEAFHGVFRLLLTKKQQEQYYKLAKKEVLTNLRTEGKNLKSELERLRNGDINKYKNWNEQSLENEYLEEYMADQFEIFKQSPKKSKTNSFIKSLFNKILEWIRNVLKRFNGNQLQTLYKDISSGKFKTAEIASNVFTDAAFQGITTDASKLLRYKEEILENGTKIYRNLPNQMGRAIVSAIAARVVNMEMKNTNSDFNILNAVEESIDKYKALYNEDNAQYSQISTQQLINLGNITDAFDLYRVDIAESVVNELALYDIKLEVVDDLNEENEMDYGLRTTEQYDKDASQNGGFRSLSAFLRKYIGTTTLSQKDEFGNEYLDEKTRERIIVPVDFGSAYSGFLKAAAGQSDPVRILQMLYIFAQNNPQTKAVQEKLFNDLGIQWEGQLEIGELPGVTEDNLLFQAVLKGFENFKVDYLFLHTDTSNGRVISYSAANRDDAHTQIDRWETEYRNKRRLYLNNPKLKDEASEKLDELLDYINPKNPIKAIANENLNDLSKEISKILVNTLGIKLHPDYIQYSIAENILNPTLFQKQLLGSKKDVLTIQWDDIVYMKEQFDSGADLMAQSEDEGVYNRLRKLGLGNASFDETVGASVFKNPNGDLVYAHQLPTFHLKRIAELNDVDNEAKALQDLIDADPYLAGNYLLNDPSFIQMSKEGLLKITRISGSKASKGIEKDSDGGVIEKFDRDEEGVVYGDYNPKEFLTALLNAYIAGVNPKSGKIVNGVIPEGQKDMVALAPVLLRVIEASNTGDMLKLPVIKAVGLNEKGEVEITNKALDAYVDNIIAEFDRIKRELNPETRTNELIPGYNATKNGQERQIEILDRDGNVIGYNRAFKFHNNNIVLTPVITKTSDLETKKLLDSKSTVLRLREGSQRIFIKDAKGAKALGFITEGVVANMEVGIGESVSIKKDSKKTKFQQAKGDQSTFHKVKLLGNRSVTSLTTLDIIDKLGAAISETKTESHKHIVNIGARQLYVESTALRDWLLGKTEFYVYQVIDDVSVDINEETKLNNLIEEEDGETGSKIDVETESEELNYGQEIARILRENATLSEDEQQDLTLDDVLKQLGKTREDLRKFIAIRIDEVFTEFNSDIQNEFATAYEQNGKIEEKLELPLFLENGLSRDAKSTGDETTFDIANKKLNLTNNRTYNLKQIFINDWINTSAINDILLGDQAVSLKDAIDAVKRAKMQNAAYYSAASRIASPEHGVKNPLQIISMFAVTDPLASSIHTNENIEQADAQNWMTVKAFRYMFFGFGKLTETQAKLLDKVESGEEITTEEIFGAAGAVKKQEMLNSKKLVYGDGKVFDKFSVVPLSKALTSRKDANGNWIAKSGREELHNMRVKMEQYEQDQLDQGIDTVAMVAPLSALKMTKYNITLIDEFVKSTETLVQKETKFLSPGGSNDYMDRRISYEFDGLENLNQLTADNVMNLDANFMGLQVINPSNKLEIVDPTQIKTLLTGEQNDAAEVFINGDKTTIGKIRIAYNRGIANRIEQKYLDKRNLVFDLDIEYAMDELHKSINANAITPDLFAFLQYAQTALQSSQSSAQLLEFFSFDEDGNPNFDLNNPISESKFKQLFLSYFSKGVMSEKIPGTSAALLSDYGFKQYRKVYSVDENGYIDRQEIIRTNDFDKNYSMSDVQMEGNEPLDLTNDDKFDVLKERVNKLKKGEFIIVKDRLRPNMKEYDSKGVYTGIKYSESLMAAHSKEVYEMYDNIPSKKIADVISKMFGIRIPSQDNHSAINIKVVDFLPVFYGSTIVSSRELVEVSGADFDIDKLYIQMKEYYEKDGELVEYKNNFEDYVKYINKATQKKGSTFAEAASKSIIRDDRGLTNAELKDAKELGFSRNAIDALRMLNLPLSKKEFDKYIEKTKRFPFSAGYNNEILDYKFALVGNEAVTSKKNDESAISYEAADMEILKDIWKEISAEIPELAEALGEDNIGANNLRDKWKAFANNKEGAKSIGAAVLPNLYLSLMQEAGVKLKKGLGYELNFGGQVYDGLYNIDKGKNRTKELLEDGTEGRRKQYIISALITAMTDNAKERLAAKLGLSRNGLAIVTVMSAMGVPIKTSVLLMNHPTVRDAYKKESRSPLGEFNVKEFIEEKIQTLKKIGSEYNLVEESEFGIAGVNQKSLIDAIKDPIVKFKNEAELKSKIEKDSEIVSKEQLIRDYSILTEFKKAYDIAQFLRPVGDLMNLAKGFGKDTIDINKIKRAREKLKLNLTDDQINDLPTNEAPLFDLRKVFTKDNWQTKMLDIYDEFVDSLLPKVFLNESVPFKNIFSGMLENMKVTSKEDQELINKDLLSYVTIRGYLHWLSQNPSSILGTPSNSLIYPEQGKKDIVDIYDELKTLNGDKYNFFLDGFVRPEKATDAGNKTGISMLTANTLTPLNDSQKIDLQNGFRELFADPVTRGLTMNVLNYMIVKDGLQPVYKSILNSVSPEMFGEYLSILPLIQDAFASMSDIKMQSTFGMSFKDLKLNFLREYALHPKTVRFLPKTSLNMSSVFNGKSKIVQSRSEITQNIVNANPNKLYVIFDNEARNGSSNSKEVRNTENVFRITIKKNAANNETDFFTGIEENDIILKFNADVESLKDLSDSYSEVVIQDEINQDELVGLQKYTPAFYDELLFKMKNNFGYNLTGLTKKDITEERKEVNAGAKEKALFINDAFDKATLTVDLYKGIIAKPAFSQDQNFVQRNYADTNKQSSKYNKNKQEIGYSFKSKTVKEGKQEKDLLIFPQVIAVKVEGKNKYFQLVRHAGPTFGEIKEGLSNSTTLGTFAEYIEVDVMGSAAQTPIGFIFGDRDSNNKVKNTVAKANETEDSTPNQIGLDTSMTNVDYEYGELPTLDQILLDNYNDFIGKDKMSIEAYAQTPRGKKIAKDYLDEIEKADVTFENGEIKIEAKETSTKEVEKIEPTTQPSTSVKPGVQELFDSNPELANPELANQVYEALGFKKSNLELDFNINEADGINITAVTKNQVVGNIELQKRDNNYFVRTVNSSYENQGIATELYKEAIKYVTEKNGVLKPDEASAPQVLSIYKKLEKEGLFKIDSVSEQWEDGRYVIEGKSTGILPKNDITPQQKQQALQLYSQYLDTVFPDSKVKDIVYHGSLENISKFNENQHFGTIEQANLRILRKADDEDRYDDIRIYSVLINVNNSKEVEDVGFDWSEEIKKAKKEGFDSLTYFNEGENYRGRKGNYEYSDNSYLVFNSENSYILGSKQDIQEFKKFVTASSSVKEGVDVELKVEDVFIISTQNSEALENDDQGIDKDINNEKLEEFYDTLSLPQKLSLQKAGIANLAELQKESKKDLYKNIDDFIDQLKQCF